MARIYPHVSLAGIEGRPGFDLTMKETPGALGAGVAVVVLPMNALRLWALITNDDPALDIGVGLGQNPTVAQHVIKPNGSFLINKEMPWTGDVRLISAGAAVYSVSEASVQT